MAKRQERLIPNNKEMIIEVVGGAKNLNEEDKAQLNIYISAGYKPVFTKREQSVKQRANSENARGKNKEYYIGTDENGTGAAIENKELREQFKALLRGRGQGFKFAEKWYAHRNMAARAVTEEPAIEWEKLSNTQKIEAIEWLKGVNIRNGVPFDKKTKEQVIF